MPSTQSSLSLFAPRPAEQARPEREAAHAAQLVCGASLEHYDNGSLADRNATVVVEEPLRIILPGSEEIILMRTPGDDANLIAGHLFSQGFIRSASDILHTTFDGRGPHRAEVGLRPVRRRHAGVPLDDRLRLDPECIFRLRDRFEQRQQLYHTTRATHAAALFADDGRLLAYGEDVSRHCAFDKAVGYALKQRILPAAAIAMLTSRLASDLAAKAAMARIPVLCGFSAATSAGMEQAEKHGITLIGRIAKDGFTVYANGLRLQA